MSITSAPIGQNRPMSISHRRDKPFIMAVIARYASLTNDTMILQFADIYIYL